MSKEDAANFRPIWPQTCDICDNFDDEVSKCTKHDFDPIKELERLPACYTTCDDWE